MAKKQLVDSTINARFLEAMQEIMIQEGIPSELRLLEIMGFQPSLLRAIKSNEKSIEPSHIVILANYGISPIWLQNGTGPFWTKDFEVFNLCAIPYTTDYTDLHRPEIIDTHIYATKDKKGYIATKHYGHAMSPFLFDGDTICMKEIPVTEWYLANSGIFGVCYASMFAIRRIKDNDLIQRSCLVLHADNEKLGGTITIPSSDISRIFHVTHVIERNVM